MSSDFEERIVATVLRHPAVQNIRLVGSRAEGLASERSDWDFLVESDGFEAVANDLPYLLASLDPLAQQWDRLSSRRCWMLILPGPAKVDLIFAEVAHEPEPPWAPSPDNLAALDQHFWDWMLWLSGKDAASKDDLVTGELRKLFDHLLAPLAVDKPPSSIAEAIDEYRAARKLAEDRFGLQVPRELEVEVAPVLGA